MVESTLKKVVLSKYLFLFDDKVKTIIKVIATIADKVIAITAQCAKEKDHLKYRCSGYLNHYACPYYSFYAFLSFIHGKEILIARSTDSFIVFSQYLLFGRICLKIPLKQ